MAIPWYIVKHYCQKHSKFTTGTAILFLATLIFYRYFLLFLVAWSFLLGVAISYIYLSSDFLLPNVLFMYTRQKKKGVGTDDELTLMKTVCTVCGQRKCPRHRPELNILAFQPWTNLEIRKSVDLAIEEFLNIVLNEFVYTWYRNLSSDEEFVDELRGTLRFFAAVILRRAKKVDVPSMVTEKILKAGLQHLHAFLEARNTAPPGSDLQQETLKYLGPNLHHAMYNRKSELEYLRRMVEKLFQYILRPQALQSKTMCALVREILSGSVLMPAMDAIANPDMVNNMLLIFLDDTPPPQATEPPSPLVLFLGGNFSKQSYTSLSDPQLQQQTQQNRSCLRLVLGDVMDPDKPTSLYPFMQFLKSEAAVNVLQFSLSCEDFNKKILDPDISEADKVKLHSMVQDLYRNYCAPSAPDRIKFEENIVNELREIVEGPPEEIVKLRTSTPMFRAYEHVYNLLNYTFLPLFHQSEIYYTMICGERVASQILNRQTSSCLYVPKPTNQTGSRQPKKKEFGISSIGSKIKEVFKSSDSRSQSPSLPDDDKDLDTLTIASGSSLEDEQQEDDATSLDEGFNEFQPPDLSTWRVSIPRLGARPDPANPSKKIFVFIVEVRRVDVASDGRNLWNVARRYGEFYVLEQKLSEFHGEFTDCMLPAKKLMGTKNEDFIDGKREPFEQYLQKLLTKPQLKGSQLLYNFLTPETDFNTGFDINIGKMLKSVPMKLVKQKGQHLEAFLSNFATSTESPKPRPSKPERRDSGASYLSTSSEKLCLSVYENNAEGLEKRDEMDGDLLIERAEIDGVFDILIYIARYVYKAPDWFHHVMLTARMFVKSTLESYLDWFIDKKVEQVTQEHRLVGLINLLRDVLFFDQDPPRTDEQKKERYLETLEGCRDFIPKPFVYAVGQDNHEVGTKLLLDVLQMPKLNKQLSYVFLDIAITELFPELKE